MGQIRILAAWESAAHGAVISPVHRGKASALNSGLAEARGEIVVFERMATRCLGYAFCCVDAGLGLMVRQQ